MKKWVVILLAAVVLIGVSSCAAGPNALENSPDHDGEVFGFWYGLWHGIIAPFAFIVSLFSDGVGVYEANNNGNWYNLGYLIGLSAVFGGSGGGAGRAGRRRG